MLVRAAKKLLRFALSDDGSVKTRVIRSGIWVSLGEMAVTVIAVVKSIFLARLLTPDMFGLMGLCGMVIRIMETFTRPGIGQALIQRRSSFEEARDTAFTLLFARGVLLAISLATIAPLAAWFFESDELERMIQVMSILFIIGGLLNINTIARQKELDFRRLSYLNQSSALLGSIITIVAAILLRNVWALVIGQLATTAVHTALSYYFVQGTPRVTIDWRIARELLSYGKFITASSAIIFVASTFDTAVIGKILGIEQLGYYTLALTIANLVTASISKLVSGIMMPAYSSLQADHAALHRAYLRTLQLVLRVTLPATVGVLVTAASIIHVVYGEKWLNAVIPLQILVIFGLFRALASIDGYLFEGIGRPQIPLYVGLIRLAILVPLIIPATIYYGLLGAAAGVTLSMAVQWLGFMYFIKRDVGVSITQIILIIADPLWKSAVMGSAVYGLSLIIDGMTTIGLLGMILSGIAVYASLNVRVIIQIRRHGL